MKCKRGGALENEEIKVINQGGANQKKSDKKNGATKKSDFPRVARGGWWQNNFTSALMNMAELDIEKVLKDMGLEIYLPEIVEQGFDDLDYLMSLGNENLIVFFSAVGISKLGHQ